MKQIITSFYDNIFQRYKTFCPDSENGEISEDFNSIKENISSLVNEQLNLILKSIIKGDFLAFDESISNDIGELCSEYQNKCRNEIIHNPDLSQYFEESTDAIFIGLKDILSEFFLLIYQFTITTNHFIHQKQTFIITTNSILYELCEYCNLFVLDYSMIDNVSYYEKLALLEKRKEIFHAAYPFNNLNIFDTKLKFLKYKWLKRQKYNSQKLKKLISDTYTEKYLFNNHIIDLDQKILIGDPYYDIYKDWVNKIEFHYFNEKQDSEFIDKSLEKDSNFNTYDLYLKVKYYKDIEPNLEQLKGLEIYFKNNIIANLPRNSKQKNELYFYNNLFSCMLSNPNITEVEIDNKYLEIHSSYRHRRNKNFFLYYKYLEFKIIKAKELITKGEIKKIDILNLHNILLTCKNHFEWCKNAFNRLYDFDKESSTILMYGIEVYHASSFSLPLSISENEQLISKIERDLTQLENEINQIKSTSYLSDFQSELKEAEKRSIETISLFTAVISFIVGTVASYQFIKSITQGIIFFIVFGISISIFLILVFITTRGSKFFDEMKKSWYLFLIPYLSAGIILFSLFDFYKNNESPESAATVNKRIDSIVFKNKDLQKQINLIKKAPLPNRSDARN
ncbi:hypothetical protein HZQ82_12245 [Elizabethkingia anophelis]|nr:hypothetical protein [Elizabethkingia anophelis]